MMEKAKLQNQLAISECPSIVNINIYFILSANSSNIHIVARAGNQKTLLSVLFGIKHTNYDRKFNKFNKTTINPEMQGMVSYSFQLSILHTPNIKSRYPNT